MPINYINLADIDRSVQNAQAGDMALQNQREAQMDRQYQRQQQEMANQRQMQISDIYKQSGGNLKGARDALYQGGFYEQGANLDKQLGESEKSDLANNEKRIKLIGSGMKFLVDNPSKQNALMTFNQLKSIGAITPEQYDEFTAQLPDDPNQIRTGAEVLFRSALDAKDQLGKIETQDIGGQVVNQNIDPVTGQVKEIGRINKTQTPEGMANRAVTMRGQNMTDARARDKNLIDASSGGYSNKPLPATALKMQNESLDKLSVASNINADLATIQSNIKQGKLKFGPVSNLANKALNMAGMSTEESRNFATFKSTLEKLRNDSLRLNTGVQTDGDAQRAWNELFENINDTAFVQQRLAEIRKINQRGAELQKLQVENIRGNYNAPPVDFSQYSKGSALESDKAPVSNGWSVRKVN